MTEKNHRSFDCAIPQSGITALRMTVYGWVFSARVNACPSVFDPLTTLWSDGGGRWVTFPSGMTNKRKCGDSSPMAQNDKQKQLQGSFPFGSPSTSSGSLRGRMTAETNTEILDVRPSASSGQALRFAQARSRMTSVRAKLFSGA
jgi:hypothetical protein